MKLGCLFRVMLYLLTEDVWPSSPDKVPCQRLTNHITGNVDNGGGGILLSDHVWIQSVFQIPEQSQSKYVC